ncbi:MAG: SPOR domain-containing protein, partial [Thermodesulfobacteriota bacterium]
MSIQFECECGETLEVGEEFAGKRGRCPSCKAIVRVPDIGPEPPQLREYMAVAPEEGEVAQGVGTDVPGEPDQERGQEEEGPGEPPPTAATAGFWDRWRKALLFVMAPLVIAGVLLYLVIDWGPQRSEQRSPKQNAPAMAAKEAGPEASAVVETPIPPASEVRAAPSRGPRMEEEKGANAEVTSQGLGEPPVVSKGEPKEVASGAAEGRSSDQVAKGVGKGIGGGGRYTVRVGSFREQERADRLASDLRKKGLDAFVWT